MKDSNLNAIVYVAQKAGLLGSLNTSTSSIADDLNVSQQTVSRLLRELENGSLIKREARHDGVTISLTDNARAVLKTQHNLLKKLFAPHSSVNAIVTSGLKEGRYYMSLPQYRKQFKEKLGFEPFEGTLNLNVDAVKLSAFLIGAEAAYINGFHTKLRTFGGLKSFNVLIKTKDKSLRAALIIPDRTHHTKDIAEIIHKDNLRDMLKLRDKDSIKIMREEEE